MTLRCWFGWHEWKLTELVHMTVTDEVTDAVRRLYTLFLYQCASCGDVKTREQDGHWHMPKSKPTTKRDSEERELRKMAGLE